MANKTYLDKSGLTYFWGKIKGFLNNKQDTLVSGTNIKTINSTSLLGSGDISIPASPYEIILCATEVKTFSNGSCNYDITALGLTTKPDVVLLTCQSRTTPMRYDFDSSNSTTLVLRTGDGVSGGVRFCIVIYK